MLKRCRQWFSGRLGRAAPPGSHWQAGASPADHSAVDPTAALSSAPTPLTAGPAAAAARVPCQSTSPHSHFTHSFTCVLHGSITSLVYVLLALVKARNLTCRQVCNDFYKL